MGEGRWIEGEDVRRAYFYAEEKRDMFVELPYHVPTDFRASHDGQLCKALYGTRPAAASWAVSLLASCHVVVFAMSPVLLREQFMEMPFLLLLLARR